MTHVHIRGPLLSISGYGVHARQIARWAFSKNFDVTVEILPWGNTPWYTNRDECDGLIGQLMEASQPLRRKPNYSFQIMLPHEWDNTLADKNFGVSAVVETDICSKEWVNACLKMDHVIVPSEFSKRCLVNSGLKSKRATVIPESFIDACLENNDSLALEFETENNFLILGQMSGDWETDRKNTAQAIALFCDTFKDSPDVGLIIKTNVGGNSTVDRHISKLRLGATLKSVRQGAFPKVYFLHGYLKDKEVSSLYHHPKVKGLISLTHGEGFGLPLLEAAACGLPVLATNWSAHTEFLNLGSWYKVKGTIEPVPQRKVDGHIFVQGAKWANPDFQSAREQLKDLKKDVTHANEQAKSLQAKIVKKYSFESVSNMYDKFFKRWK